MSNSGKWVPSKIFPKARVHNVNSKNLIRRASVVKREFSSPFFPSPLSRPLLYSLCFPQLDWLSITTPLHSYLLWPFPPGGHKKSLPATINWSSFPPRSLSLFFFFYPLTPACATTTRITLENSCETCELIVDWTVKDSDHDAKTHCIRTLMLQHQHGTLHSQPAKSRIGISPTKMFTCVSDWETRIGAGRFTKKKELWKRVFI